MTIDGGSTQICGNSSVIGGDGYDAGIGSAAPGNGINLSGGGALRVLDGFVAAGHFGFIFPNYTILVQQPATLRISPRVGLGSGQGPSSGSDVMPQLSGTSALPGGSMMAAVDTEIGDLTVLAVGLPGPTTTVPGLVDPLWLDPIAHHAVLIAVQQPSAILFGTVFIPNHNAFLGVQLNWGAVCYGPVTGFQATNPAATLVY